MKDKLPPGFEQMAANLNIDEMKKGVESFMTKVSPMFDKIAKENEKLIRPKSKKNITFNGVNVAVSLIEDGRVLISLPTLDDAQTLYDKLEVIEVEKKTRWQHLKKVIKL